MADARRPSHLYQNLAEQLRLDMQTGLYTPSDKLPSMERLAKKYGVSRLTVRAALKQLEAEGWVRLRQGSGTVVTEFAQTPARRRASPSAEENFRSWKAVVRLSQEFPRLSPLKWEELDPTKKMYMRPAHYEKVHDILVAAGADANIKPYTVVQIKRGHGCTTLFRFVHKYLTTREKPKAEGLMPAAEAFMPAYALGAKVITARVSWPRLGTSESEFQHNLDASIRADILRELVRPKWKEIVPPIPYARVIGALREEQQEHGVLERHLEQLRDMLPEEAEDEPELSPPDLPWERLRDVAPTLVNEPISKLMYTLKEKLGIKTLLMFDLSRGQLDEAHYNQRVDQLVGTIKDFHETTQVEHFISRGEEFRPLPSLELFFSEMYFLDRDTQDFISGVFVRSPYVIEYPHYEQADVFGILARHYPPIVDLTMVGKVARSFSTMDLAAVFGSNLLGFVHEGLAREGKSFGDVPLLEIVKRLEEKILEMMRVSWSRLTYHLMPPGVS